MSRVTTKLQVTLPKAIADRYGIAPGDEIQWVVSEDTIRVVPGRQKKEAPSIEARLRLFDQATERQRARGSRRDAPRDSLREKKAPETRGWSREDLYDRGRTR